MGSTWSIRSCTLLSVMHTNININMMYLQAYVQPCIPALFYESIAAAICHTSEKPLVCWTMYARR